MDVAGANTVNMAEVLTCAYELGDMINESVEVSDYLYCKQRVAESVEIAVWIRELEAKKELFAETKRFGHFHPDYHAAKAEVEAVETQLEQFEEVRRFKQAEKMLDHLLHDMSEMIAKSVSDSIKVPGNDPSPSGGCGSGGKCACG